MRPVVFTDKFGRTIMVMAVFPNADASSVQSSLSADEIVGDLLAKVPGSEFVRLPSRVNLSDAEALRVVDRLFGREKKEA